MKFPYGICDFKKIVESGYFYCDRTHLIPRLEKGTYHLFIRPRRFGKSLLLSTLANYYDAAKAGDFESLFGKLAVGKHPTPLRNRYFILKWDFSCVDSSGSLQDVKKALHNHVNTCIDGFLKYYRDFEIEDVTINPEDAVSSIGSLISSVRGTGRPICLLLDEYDNFANEIMMGVHRDNRRRYEALVYEEGPLRTLFKAVKASTSESLFDRIFITGVSPVVMSDITSGYNIAEDIYLEPAFNEICGLTHSEIAGAVKSIAEECGSGKESIDETLDMIRSWYDGYKFAPEAEEAVYNPTMAIYFLKKYQDACAYPRKMLDSNLTMDAAKLEYISRLSNGRQLLLRLMREDRRAVVTELSDRFGIREMLEDRGKDRSFMASFLYFFGVLTFSEVTPTGKLALKIPNLAIRKLYAQRIGEMLLPEPADRDDGTDAAEKLYQDGDMGPLCEFVEQRFFKVFHNPDYRGANELAVKTAFLTLLYNDILYVMDSESEIDRRYADLTMIIRPDMRQYAILDILIEFKFVSLKSAGLKGEQARNLTNEQLGKIPQMAREMRDAKSQLRDYGRTLEKRHKDLRLRKYAVVSLGFERIWWEEAVGEP